MDFERLLRQASDEQDAARERAAREDQSAERSRAQRTKDAFDIVHFARLIAEELQARQTPYDHKFVNEHQVPVRKGIRTKHKKVEVVLAAGWTYGLDTQLMEVSGPRLSLRAEGLLLSEAGKVLGVSIDTPAPTNGCELSQRAVCIGGNTQRIIEEFDPTGEARSTVFELNDYHAIEDMLVHVAIRHDLGPALFR